MKKFALVVMSFFGLLITTPLVSYAEDKTEPVVEVFDFKTGTYIEPRAPYCICGNLMVQTRSTEEAWMESFPCLKGWDHNDILVYVNEVIGWKCNTCGTWRRVSTTKISEYVLCWEGIPR